MAKLILGCGYLGLRVARLWMAEGHTVYAVSRSAERASSLAAEGLRPLVADVVAGQKPEIPTEICEVLFAIGNDRRAGLATTEVYGPAIRHALRWLPDSAQRLVYISTTGVYGQTGGEWVDESSPCEPATEGGRASLAAERAIGESRFAERRVILRLAGLYGPGRLPKAADILAGNTIEAAGEGWLNLIHVDDAARIAVAAAARAPAPRTYVVSDGQPTLRREFYEELARLLHAPAPRFASPGAASSAARRALSDKRVRPQRLGDELAVTLLYPDFRAGLAAIIAAERTPGSSAGRSTS